MRMVHLVAAVLVTIAFAFAPVAAQGTSNTVPEPISTAELHDLMRRYVQPTRDHWDAIEGLHDDYRDSFKQLREGEIQKFLDSTNELQGGGFPERAKFEKFMRDFERVSKRVAEVDTTLFDGIAVVVGEDKKVGVNRAANARLRSRELQGGMMASFGLWGSVDVSTLALDVLIENPEVLATITPDLIEYEERLTTNARGAGEEARGMWSDVFKKLEEAGFSAMTEEEMRSNPERMTQLMETSQKAMEEAMTRIQKRAEVIRSLNDRTFRSLSNKLSGPPARRFRVAYIQRAHPMVGYDTTIERLFASIDKSSKVDAETKERLRGERTTFLQADDALIEQMIKVNDELAGKRSMFNPAVEGVEELTTKLEELRGKRQDLSARTLEALKSSVGDERLQKVMQKLSMSWDENNPLAAVDIDQDTDDGVGAELSEAEAAEATMMQAMSGAMSSVDVGVMQAILGSMSLDAGMKSTVETMHADYQKTWSDAVQPLLNAASEAQTRQWSHGENGEFKWNAKAVEEYQAKQLAAIEKGIEIDDAFFDDLLKVLGDGHEADLVVARLDRAIMTGQARANPYAFGMWGGEYESPVQYSELLADPSIPEPARVAVRASLAEAAKPSIKKLQELDRAALRLANESQTLSMGWQESAGDGNQPDGAAVMKFQEAMRKLQAESNQQLADRDSIRTTLLASIIEAAGSEHRDAIQLAYEKRAYPTIFNDARSAMRYIDSVAALGNLSDSQRSQLEVLRTAYERDHLDACRRMIVRPAKKATEGDLQEGYRQRMEMENQRAKVGFERDERSARAVSQLRRILTDEQIKQIPGLSDYEQNIKKESQFGVPSYAN